MILIVTLSGDSKKPDGFFLAAWSRWTMQTQPPPRGHSEDALHLLETALAYVNGSFPPVAIMLHYLYTIAEKFPVQEYRVIAMRPHPQRGLGWHKGGYHH